MNSRIPSSRTHVLIAVIKVWVTVLLVSVSTSQVAQAVTTLSRWRMGDNDSPNIDNTQAISTADSVGNRRIDYFAPSGYRPIYQSIAPAVPGGNSKSLVFALGTYGITASVPALTDNFGFEIWALPGDLTSTGYLVWNGSATDGWGIIKAGNYYYGVFMSASGEQINLGPAVAKTSEYTHLALVRENGKMTFYVDGEGRDFSDEVMRTATGSLKWAVDPNLSSFKFYGSLDEARLFSFAGGTFSKTKFLYPRQSLTADPNNAILTTVGGAGDVPRTYHTRWMEGLPDSMLISELSIPGTHDSGAEVGNTSHVLPSYSDCQDAEVYNQLVSGVRCLDLRIERGDGEWMVHHADYTYRTLFLVLNDITRFLTINPSETVLCRLSADVAGDAILFTQTYSQIRDTYTNIWQRPGAFRVDGITPTQYAHEAKGIDPEFPELKGYLDNLFKNGSYNWPTLGEVRGKMVMFLSPDPLLLEGGGFCSGLSFGNGPTNISSLFRSSLRDDFDNGDYVDKRKKDLEHIYRASTNISKTVLYATGLNIGAQAPFGVPRDHALEMNKYFVGLLNEPLFPDFLHKTGIVIMDFPGPAILQSLIARNFRHNSSAATVRLDFSQYALQLPFNMNLTQKDEVWQARAWRRLVKERLPSAEFNTFMVKEPAGSLLTFSTSFSDETNSLSSALGPVLNHGWAVFESHRLPSAYTKTQVQTLLDSTLNITGDVSSIRQQFDTLMPSNTWCVIGYSSTGLPAYGSDFDTNVVFAMSHVKANGYLINWIVAGAGKPVFKSTNASSRAVVGHWEYPFPNAIVGRDLGDGLQNFLGTGYVSPTTQGVQMHHGDFPNGGPSSVRMHQWTLVMDVLLQTHRKRSLIQIDSLDNTTEGEVFISSEGALGIDGQYYGTMSLNKWHRVVVAVDATQEQRASLYIDGIPLGDVSTRTFSASGDVTNGFFYFNVDRWSLQETALLFGDVNGDAGDMFVGGIQLRNYKMSDDEVLKLGGLSIQTEIIGNDAGKVLFEISDKPELRADSGGFFRMVPVPSQLKLSWEKGVLQWTGDLSQPFTDVPNLGVNGTYYPALNGGQNQGFFRVRP